MGATGTEGAEATVVGAVGGLVVVLAIGAGGVGT